MRNAFASEITNLADHDDRIVLLAADIGNRLFDTFKEKHPTRFYNAGVAEANMIGVAAGLAATGLRPVCYTIANFITYRCLEQIRIDLCYHNQPVMIVGTGAGLSYASLGATHHTCEEIGMLRLLPGLVVIAPADQREVRCALRAALQQNSPVYLRLGKKGEPDLHHTDPDFHLGRALPLREGKEICLLSTGNMVASALQTAELLESAGYSTAVVSFHTIKPLDELFLNEAFSCFRLIATIEEHSILGGLGGSIAEWLSDYRTTKTRLMRFGTRDEFLSTTSTQSSAREFFGLTPQAMSTKIINEYHH